MSGAKKSALVFTIQHEVVLSTLAGGEAHRQDWLKSAAYSGTPEDPTGTAHRRAYRWAAAQYAKRMGRRMKNAPVWLSLTPFNLASAIKSEYDRPIALLVPKDELLVFQYYGGDRVHWECVLQNLPCCDGSCCAVTGATRKHVRETWERLFENPRGLVDCQAIIDRIEPEWYLGPAQDIQHIAKFIERYDMYDFDD